MIPAPGTDRNRLVATTAGLFLGGLAYFLTLSDYAEFLYKTTDYWYPEFERSLLWNDSTLGIAYRRSA